MFGFRPEKQGRAGQSRAKQEDRQPDSQTATTIIHPPTHQPTTHFSSLLTRAEHGRCLRWRPSSPSMAVVARASVPAKPRGMACIALPHFSPAPTSTTDSTWMLEVKTQDSRLQTRFASRTKWPASYSSPNPPTGHSRSTRARRSSIPAGDSNRIYSGSRCLLTSCRNHLR